MKPFATFDELLGTIAPVAQRSTDLVLARSLGDHVFALGEAATEREPALRSALSVWAVRLRTADLPLSPSTQALVVALAAIATITSEIGATWRVLLQQPPS